MMLCLKLFVIEKRKALLEDKYVLLRLDHEADVYPPPIRPLSSRHIVTDAPLPSQLAWKVAALAPCRLLE